MTHEVTVCPLHTQCTTLTKTACNKTPLTCGFFRNSLADYCNRTWITSKTCKYTQFCVTPKEYCRNRK